MKKYKRGYTQGVYDMFHVGHLNLINHAKMHCEYLVVAVNADQLVMDYKHKSPVISQEERRYIVENIRAVDEAVIAFTLDKIEQLKKYRFDAIFIGYDWKGNPRWKATEEELSRYGVDVVYLPHTDGISSTSLTAVKENQVEE